MLGWWNYLTDFGDTAVTVPLAVLMAGFLVIAKQRHLALGWCAAILGCAAMTGALKLAFTACGAPLIGTLLRSPSGHSAMSIAVYGGFAAVIGARLAPPQRVALIAGAVALAIAIAVSRIVLRNHGPFEVVVGLAVGGGGLAAIIMVVARHPPSRLPIAALAATAIAVAMLFHGERWPAERIVRGLAGWFDRLRPWCS